MNGNYKIAKEELGKWYGGDKSPVHIEQAEYFFDKAIEELTASRVAPMLSEVPSELEKKLINKILRAQRYLELSENKKAWDELYLTPDERGIAG